jgi:hypothetical protein
LVVGIRADEVYSVIAAVGRLGPTQVNLEVYDVSRSISNQSDNAEMDTYSRK